MALVQTENVGNQFTGLGGLPIFRQLGLLIGLAASVAVGMAIVMWSQTPSYRLLYSDISSQDTAQVAAALQSGGFEYKIDDASGRIWIAGGSTHEARMMLASQGLPEGGNVGFELMDKKDSFGSSQFIESIRYQRALEGELARTISSLKSIQTARVHLAIPKQSVFVRNRKKSSASVTVGLYPGRYLEQGQVRAIVGLISSSVPELESGMITVVDQVGKMLTSEHDGAMAFSTKQLEYKDKIEKSYIERIEDILSPIVGDGRVRAKVNAEIDFTVTEKTQESFNPDQSAIRSEQTSSESRGGGSGPVGIPGALSNQPPEAGTVGGGESGAAATVATMANKMLQSTRNYELDKTISHVRLATGSVRRLSVAVVIDNKAAAVDGGETVAYTDDEIQRFNQLVRDSVGFNIRRGDSVNVINAAFSPITQPEPLPEVPLWEQSWVWDIGKQVLGGLGILLLVFGVLKPVMRELASKGVEFKEYNQNAFPSQGGGEVSEDGTQVTLSAEAAAQQVQQQGHESNIASAIAMVDQDPRTVAQVMKTWVATDGA
ncbi:MAG: flagellar M-ring protein FliF [Sulfuriflexus sp.]|nr:flagellar M-ring protein FliF [Sulfuriflexus sp.]